ncbi:hypothetical protein D3C71_808040 [compost metagenome]
MRPRTAAAAQQGNIAGVAQELRQFFQLLFRRCDDRLRRVIPVGTCALRRGFERHVTRQHHHRHAAIKDRFTHGDGHHLRDLLRRGDQFAIVATFTEQLLRMRLLKIAAADFARRNMRRYRQHRNVVAMAVEQTVNQMQVARPARASAHRQFARQLRFSTCGKGRHLFVTGRHPVNGAHSVEAVA